MKKPKPCSIAAPATPTIPASSAPSMSPLPTGSPSTCSRSLPIATENSSSARSPNPASIHFRAHAVSCSPREAHYMFVSETGIARIIQRTCDIMKENKIDDPSGVRCTRRHRSPNHPALSQFPFTASALDLYGSRRFLHRRELFHQRRLKGRFREIKLADDHILAESDLHRLGSHRRQNCRQASPPRSPRSSERLRDDCIGRKSKTASPAGKR